LRTLTEVIGHDEFDRSIIPHLTQLSTDKIWRVKLALINFMPELAQFLDSSLFKDRLESVIMNLMSDPVFQIREEAIQLLLTLKDKNKPGGPFDQRWLQDSLESKAREFHTHEKFA
jgi:serine/threonine-protein phosphatase 2A regulatory subunit A